jgi:hypothetical protein
VRADMNEPVRRHFQHKYLPQRGYIFAKILSEPEQLEMTGNFI